MQVYNQFDILRTFLRLDRQISRADLVKELDIGEGSIRSILDTLKEKGFIISTKQGHSLTSKGKLLHENISEKISISDNVELQFSKDFKKVSLLLNSGDKNLVDVKKRDTAIRLGAEAVLILVYEDGKLTVPYYDGEYPCFKSLFSKFDISEDDIVIVVSAEKDSIAENSCLAIALDLSLELKGLVQGLD